jgi:Mn2+/Fe2+ NRAMP family transporter
MKTQESKENFILNLFDWRIKKLLALQYFKVLYLITLILITIAVVLYEFYIARYLGISASLKFLLGIGTVLGGLVAILFVRIVYEFYFAFFYIEKHLRELNPKS